MSDPISRREMLGLTAGIGLGLPALAGLSPREASAASHRAADALPPRTLIQAPPLRDVPGWVRTHLRLSHLPPPDWPLIEAHLKAGVTSLTTNMNTRYAVVGPSASLYKPEVVQEADETMRRYVRRVHAAGVKAIFYIGPIHVPDTHPEFLAAHPDWLLVRADGTPMKLGNFRSGYGDWLIEQLAYIVRTYNNDGFWFDGYSGWLYSYDETSKRLFREVSGGKEIPARIDPKDPVWRQYLLWHWQGYVDYADRLRGVLRRENPEAVIFANYSACREWYLPNDARVEYPAPYANAVDIPSLEQYWDTPGDALNQQFLAAFLEGVTHNRGAAVWAQPQAFGTVGLSAEVELRLRYLLGSTRGVYCEFVEDAGREEYVQMWSDDMKAREAWMQQSAPIPWVGLVASEQTRMLYGGRSSLTRYFSHALGAFRALMESHRPVGILTEYDLEDNRLDGIAVLVLPNVACLSDRAAEVIRRFVQRGGGLVATYETSLFDHAGERRQDFALGDLFHARYQSSLPVRTRDDALALFLTGRHPITDDPILAKNRVTGWMQPDNPRYGRMMLLGSSAQVRMAAGGAEVVYYREKENAPNAWPAAIVSQVGKGRVVYFPAGVDKAMFFYPAAYLRQLVRNACDWAANAPPPLEVVAPYILATTFRAQPEKSRTVVHLLNDASSWGRHSLSQQIAPQTGDFEDPGHPQSSDLRGTWPMREEVIPIHDVRVICRRRGVKKATQQPEGLNLPLTPVAGGVQVTVPKVDLHTMVVFE
jgi:hypothetical protein